MLNLKEHTSLFCIFKQLEPVLAAFGEFSCCRACFESFAASDIFLRILLNTQNNLRILLFYLVLLSAISADEKVLIL